MLRKELVNAGGTISLAGKELLAFMSTEESIKLVPKKTSNENFLTWWGIFPPTDTFTHRNVTFTGTRALRSGKPRCEMLFNKIINKGEYTAEEIIAATTFDINQKKENSVKKGSNQLTYMQNSATYLFNDSYEGFISLIKSGQAVQEGATKANEIDI